MIDVLLKGKLKYIFAAVFSWYSLVGVPVIGAVYYFIAETENSGLMREVKTFIHTHLLEVEQISKKCSKEIRNVDKTFDCIASTGNSSAP